MPCFCTVPADTARNLFSVGVTPLLPTPPPALELAAALPSIDPASRLDRQIATRFDRPRRPDMQIATGFDRPSKPDMQIATGLDQPSRPDMQIATGFDPEVLANIDADGGPMAQTAKMLSLMSGHFALNDPPLLETQMRQAAGSIARNLWPRLGRLTTLKVQPLVNFSTVARHVLDLQALGIDPFTATDFPPMPDSPSMSDPHGFDLALTPTQIKMAKLLAGLPPIMQLSETLDIPPLGDTEAPSALQGRLDALANLTPPDLAIPLPSLTKLALVLESLATIRRAFGDDISSSEVDRIRSMLARWTRFPAPVPRAALTLRNKLDTLPTLEEIRLGESIAGSSNTAIAAAQISPPKLSIAPFMNVALALRGAMQMALDMQPFDMCSTCPCA